MRAFLAFLALLGLTLGAEPAWAEIGLVTGDPATLTAARQEALLSVEATLDDYGLAHRRIDEELLSGRTLRPFDLIVLPLGRVPQLEPLKNFAMRGGRWVAFQTTGAAGINELLGLRAAPLAAGFQPTAVVPETRPGTPAKALLGSGEIALLPVRAEDPALEAGRWDRPGSEVSALVRGPHGYFANFAPGSGAGQAELLMSMLMDLEPLMWSDALQYAERRAAQAVRSAATRWSYARRRSGLSDERRAAIDAALHSQRERLTAGAVGPLEISSNRMAAAERVKTARRQVDECEQLAYRMSASRKGELRGIWYYQAGKTDWEAVMRTIRDSGLNSVFVRVSRGGSAIYPSELLPRESWAVGGPDELKLAIEAARKYGIAFHAWRIDFHLGSAPPELLEKLVAEDRLVRGPDGKQGRFLNPGDPRNQEHEFQAIMELVRKYDIDGFHFDYIRYPEEPHYDWDYGPVSRREFEKASGKPVQQWPGDVISGPRKREYEEWERENINRLVQRVSQEIKRVKPFVQVSAAVWRNHRKFRAAIKQDWPLWVDRGWLDFVVPMDYTRELETLATDVEEQVAVVRGKAPVIAGLGGYLENRPLEVVRQVEVAREVGADGFVIFSYTHPGVDAQLAALRAGATSEDTAPTLQAPRVEWLLTPAVEQKDGPLALLQSDRAQLEVKLAGAAPGRMGIRSTQAELRVEDGEGRLLQALGTLNFFNLRRVRFEVPAGRFRPTVNGTVTYVDGSVRPFVVRGPICDGVSAQELTELRAHEAPPVVAGDGRRTAVFAGGLGAAGWMRLLGGTMGVRAFPLYRIRPDHLATAQVLVLPALRDVAELTPEAEKVLRDWVSAGGVLVATYDAVGARWHPALFPEVAVAGQLGADADLELVKAVGERAVGAAFRHGSADHWRLHPAPGAEVVVREAGAGGAAVLVSGKVGKGRVVLYGAAPGYPDIEITEVELAVLRALILKTSP